MKVLYINHYGAFGGAQRSMLEMLDSFPGGIVDPVILSPKGRATTVFKKSGIAYYPIAGISKFDHTRYSYYRGMRWMVLCRELLYFFPTVWFFISKRKMLKDIDLVHINEVTCLLPLVLAKRMLKKPVIVHARAVLNMDTRLRRTRFITKLLDRYADNIIAIDYTVAASILTGGKPIVIHNGLRLDGILGRTPDSNLEDKLKGLPRRKLTLGFIGRVSQEKGIFELMEAVKQCVSEGVDVNLVIIGNNSDNGHSFLEKLLKGFHITFNALRFVNEFITTNRLQGHIHMIDFSTDLKTFYQYIDVVVFPSHYNALGRPVFEAAFFHKPAIVAIENPLPDTFIEEVTGLRVEINDSSSIYTAVRRFYDDPDAIPTMGKGAYELAVSNFDIEKNAIRVAELYKKLL
jgi:glycosyltransferase involved in cell wall biosynthesis